MCRRGSGRIIPACAGNSETGRRYRHPRLDHPRVCGELMTSRACGLRATGSSPRVRGTLAIQQARCARIRIIPACAGNSVCEAKPTSMGADHPRVCGELAKAATRNSLEDGSSPRVRGTPVNVRDDAHLARIIPACAGNSTLRVRRLLSLPDHPRVCGELAILSKEYGGKGGSSPRVRGTRAQQP